MAPILRFFRYVTPKGVNACWLWTGATTKQESSPGTPHRGVGYGVFALPRNDPSRQSSMGAHKFSYRTFVGPIPYGHEIDHTCRIRNCVNPRHLEAVTPEENARRVRGR